jgi:26S proteasome regulatory subunit N2
MMFITHHNKKRRDIEPTFFFLPNPCRITRAQSHVCAFDVNQRYRPISLEEKPYGIMMLVDKTPEVEEDLGTVITPSIKSDDEADATKAFEWTPPEHLDAQMSGERDVVNGSCDTCESSKKK